MTNNHNHYAIPLPWWTIMFGYVHCAPEDGSGVVRYRVCELTGYGMAGLIKIADALHDHGLAWHYKGGRPYIIRWLEFTTLGKDVFLDSLTGEIEVVSDHLCRQPSKAVLEAAPDTVRFRQTHTEEYRKVRLGFRP